jgi:glycosyltransferase involved in cell wall biosynthesis
MGVDTDVPGKDDPGVEEIRNLYSPGSGPFLVFVGRLVEEKGIGDLLEAVLILRQSFPGICLVIAGEGQDRHLFETMVRRLGLIDCVRFSGWLEEAKVPVLLASADIFVSPSRNEAQGLSILEAMSARTPVVATRVGGVVDSVIHETTGLLVDESAPQQIAAAVERLVRDDGLSARLASNARERVVAGFSRASSARAFSELFEELAAKRRVE